MANRGIQDIREPDDPAVRMALRRLRARYLALWEAHKREIDMSTFMPLPIETWWMYEIGLIEIDAAGEARLTDGRGWCQAYRMLFLYWCLTGASKSELNPLPAREDF